VLSRYPDWPTRLDQFLYSHSGIDFEYGRWDCCLFVADAIVAMTGADVAERFRGTYGSRKEALRAVKQYTGQASIKAVAETLFRKHGMREVPVLCAQRGDAVLVSRGKDHSLGLIALNGKEIVAVSKDSLLRWPLDRAVRAWRV
jgi:hypothetical protein